MNLQPITDVQELLKLIPQRPPIVLVHQLLEYDASSLTSGFTVPGEHLFVKDGILQEGGLTEHMAQSVALHTGYSFYIKGETAPTGYIGAINKLEILQLPASGTLIMSKIEILQEFAGVTLVNITVSQADRVIATGQMKTIVAT
ncbi:MAG: hypothetical protein J0G96_03125 [Flavobacteriia bacterium]|nr:hypothetical protein [Flavobacteriia bacterium]OJX35187.1 MAG: hypothetical protein BGO87_09855 [Flavobacteriia bacterium 40-80]